MTALAGIGQYSPLALAVGLLTLMATALFKGWLIPRAAAEHMFAAWREVEDVREAARKEEREQVVQLLHVTTEAMNKLTEVLR